MQGASEDIPENATGQADRWSAVRQSTVARPTLFKGPLHPTLRANPFPEVTDLFCRLPLSTFFYRLEAANLGDLMR